MLDIHQNNVRYFFWSRRHRWPTAGIPSRQKKKTGSGNADVPTDGNRCVLKVIFALALPMRIRINLLLVSCPKARTPEDHRHSRQTQKYYIPMIFQLLVDGGGRTHTWGTSLLLSIRPRDGDHCPPGPGRCLQHRLAPIDLSLCLQKGGFFLVALPQNKSTRNADRSASRVRSS